MRRFVFLFIMLSICTSLYSQNLKKLQRKVDSLVLQGWYQLALDEIEKDWGSIDILQNDSEELFIIAFIALLRFLIMIVPILSLLNYLIRLLLGSHQNNVTNI